MKKFLITTVVGIATTASFGAASLKAPQIGGTPTVATPTATTNTARAGTMRAQTMKTSSISAPASVTTTQSIATPVSTETTDARIALLKGIKGFNPGKVKDTAAATSELNSLNDRIEELTAQLDRAEAAQSNIITESNLEAKIDEKLATSELVTRDQLQQIVAALPNYRSDLQKVYNKTINGQRYYCEIWQISIPEWNAIESTFITPKCYDHDVIYGRTCILDGEARKLQNTDYKWRFNLCYLDNNTASVAEHYNTIGIDNPLQATEGFTILTNASDARIDDVYIPAFCGHETNYWCGKYSIDGEYNYDNPQDRTLKIYRRLEGIYMTKQTFEQSGTNTWIVQRYATNEPGENSTKAEVAEYVRAQACEGKDEDECFVPEESVYIFPTTLWARPRYQVDVYMPYTPPAPAHFTQIGYDNPLQATEGFTIATNATDAEINNGFIPTFCGHESNYWCGKYSIDGEYNYDNPQDRTLKMYRRREGIYMTKQTFAQYGNDTWDCQKYMTNEPDGNSTTATVAEHVSAQACQGKEANECFVTNVFVHQTTLWAKPRYEVEVCSLVGTISEAPTPLIY